MTTEAIRQAAVDRALRMLDAAGAVYAVQFDGNSALRMLDAAGAVYAVQFDGNTYGTLPIAPPPPSPKQREPDTMTYNPKHDRDYWRCASDAALIEAARDSGNELAIALGERLSDTIDIYEAEGGHL